MVYMVLQRSQKTITYIYIYNIYTAILNWSKLAYILSDPKYANSLSMRGKITLKTQGY